MKKLSIIIPVYNEENTIETVLKKIFILKLKGWKKEIIAVNDASTDKSAQIINKYKKRLKIIHHFFNRGKGSAIRSGIKKATGDYIIIQDADLEYDPTDIQKLIKAVDKSNIKAVYGSRFGKKSKDMVPFHKEANILLTAITNLLYGSKLTDMETCYKLIETKLVKCLSLKAKRFEFEPEITTKLLKKGVKIKEIPISYTKRGFTDGKKIGFFDGIMAIYVLLKNKL